MRIKLFILFFLIYCNALDALVITQATYQNYSESSVELYAQMKKVVGMHFNIDKSDLSGIFQDS